MGLVNIQIPDTVISEFFPGQTPLSFSPHGNGLINHTLKLLMPSGKYLLQRVNLQVFPDPDTLAHNIHQLHQHLSNQASSLQILQPVYTHDNQPYAISPDRQYWRIFEFIDHAQATDQVQDPQQAFLTGQAFGTFLRLLSTLPPTALRETIPHFHNSMMRWTSFCRILQSDPHQRAAMALPEIQTIQHHHRIFHDIASLPLPTRIVHNDAKIGNILFCNATGKVLAVTDWDTVMPGTLLADFGDLTRSIVNPFPEDHPNIDEVDINIPHFQKLCEGFLQALDSVMLPIEKDNLLKGAQWIVLEQAMRFLADYIAGDTYYTIDYPDHNLVRARNQCKLFTMLLEHEKELLRYIQC
jgi:hypothetical protein